MNHIFTLENKSLLICAYLSTVLSCSKDESTDVFRSLTYQSVTSQIFGGVFHNNQADQSNNTLNVDVIPTSLDTHIDVYTEGCYPVNIAFNLNRNPSRYKLKLRAYREVREGSVLYQGISTEHIRANGNIYIPITQPKDIPFHTVATSSELQQNTWLLQFNQGNYHFQINHQSDHLNDLDSPEVCSVPKQTTDQGLLIRQQLSYQFTETFKVVFLPPNIPSNHLSIILSELDTKDIDGVVSFYNSDSSQPVFNELQKTSINFNHSKLFWWAIPSRQDRIYDDLKSWLSIFAISDFAADLGHVRLMFLDTTDLYLSQSQLEQVERWISPSPLSPSSSQQIHTRALITRMPLVNPRSGYELNYKPGALRTLSDLRKAHMTHQISSYLSYLSDVPTTLDHLGTSVLVIPSFNQNQLLMLEIDPDCPRNPRGTQCFSHTLMNVDSSN